MFKSRRVHTGGWRENNVDIMQLSFISTQDRAAAETLNIPPLAWEDEYSVHAVTGDHSHNMISVQRSCDVQVIFGFAYFHTSTRIVWLEITNLAHVSRSL